MNIITQDEYEFLLRNDCSYDGYVEGLGIAGADSVAVSSPHLTCPNHSMMGITRDTTFTGIRQVPKIIPVIPIDRPKINHDEIKEALKKITEPGFTPSTKFWIRKLEEEINNKKETNNKNIADLQTEYQQETRENARARITGKIAEYEENNRLLNEVISEIKELAVSNQVYHVVVDSSLSQHTPTGSSEKAWTDYDLDTKQVVIALPNSNNLVLFAHELKHAYQFEKGTYSPRGFIREDGIATFQKGTYGLYDQVDEIEGYARGNLFGSRETFESNRSLYGKLPAVSERLTPEQIAINVRIINDPNTSPAQRALCETNLQNMADYHKVIFHANGKTYSPNRR